MTQIELKQKLKYDSTTGIFTWLSGKYKNKQAGTIGGTLPDNGYIKITINKKEYKAHRLAWLYVHGEFPPKLLDHINRDRTDNRIDNLRVADDATNSKNQTLYKNNTSGYHGITSHGDKWRARINVNGKKIHLGIFENLQDAVKARKQAELQYDYHPNHGVTKA